MTRAWASAPALALAQAWAWAWAWAGAWAWAWAEAYGTTMEQLWNNYGTTMEQPMEQLLFVVEQLIFGTCVISKRTLSFSLLLQVPWVCKIATKSNCSIGCSIGCSVVVP